MKYENDRLPIICIKDFTESSEYQFKKGEIYYCNNFYRDLFCTKYLTMFFLKEGEFLVLFSNKKFREYFKVIE